MTGKSKIAIRKQTEVPVDVRKAAAELAGCLGPPPSGRSLSLTEIDDAIAEAVIADVRRIGSQSRKGKINRRQRTKI